MSLSRRALFSRGSGFSENFAQLVAARGREALVAELGAHGGEAGIIAPPQGNEIRLTSNENPLGPPPAAMAAIRDGFAEGSRYPSNVTPSIEDLRGAVAARVGAEPANIVMGAGSGELLKRVAQAFVTPERHLVTARPTYLQTQGVAETIGAEVKAVPLTEDGKLDLDTMADASVGAGLVFVCNPNNPTGTVHNRDDVHAFMQRVHGASPDTVIHFDEAYHEYVTDPAYETMAAVANEMENVFVTRTFSKLFGLAGMRVGYGIAAGATIDKLRQLELIMNIAVPSAAGAYAALDIAGFEAEEKERNTEARAFTVDFFEGAGFDVFHSNTNFIFANIGRPAADFRAACREHGVGVGRDFPPMNQTHARISIGTIDEMRRACEVFQEVLA